MKITQPTSDHVSGTPHATDEAGPSTSSRSPLHSSSPAQLSELTIGVNGGRGSPMDASSMSLLAPRLKLAEATKPCLTKLPRHLQLAIADRAKDSAIPLALTNKAMLASTSSVAAKAFMLKRLKESDDAQAVRDVLHQVLNMLDFDAEMRGEILRNVATRIWVTEENALLLDEFLSAIEPLESTQRTDALTSLARSSLKQGPYYLSRVEKMLDAINLESLARRARLLAALGESLAEGLTPRTEVELLAIPEPEEWVELSEIGSDDSTAPSFASLPPSEHGDHVDPEAELGADLNLDPDPDEQAEDVDAQAELAAELHQAQDFGPDPEELEPELHLAPDPELHAAVHFDLEQAPELQPEPEAQPFAILSLLQQSIEALSGRADAADALAALAESLRLLNPHEALHRESFDFIAREVERLPANARSSTLEGLARLVPLLEQEPLRGFHQVAAAIERSGPQHASAALGMLIVMSDRIPQWLKSGTLDRISRMVQQVSPAPRASMLAALSRDIENRLDGESEHRGNLRTLVRQAIKQLPDEFRGIALVGRATLPVIEGQPPIDEQLFDEITSMVEQLPAEHRAVALTAIASRISDLEEDKRQPRLEHLLTLAEAVPAREKGKPLSELIRKIETMPYSETRDHLWNEAMRVAGESSPDGRAECIAELANQIRSLSTPLRMDAFEYLSAAASALPKENRRDPFHSLAKAVRELPGNVRQKTFDRRLGMMDEVPAEHRAVVLAALALSATHLPEGPTSKGDRQAGPAGAFDSILRLIEGLSDMDRQYVLNNLAFAQSSLVEKRHALDLIFEAIGRLPVEKRSSVLILLLDTIKWSSDTGEAMNRHLAGAISVLEALPADHLGSALGALAAGLPMDLLEPEAREHVFPTLLDLAERVPRRDLELPILALARLLHKVPEPKQMQLAFDRLLEMTGQNESHLPMQTMGALLTELAIQLHALPERPQLSSAWNSIKSLFIGRELHTTHVDGLLAGMVSAAPWLEDATQAKAIDMLLQAIKSIVISEKSVVALARAIPNLAPRFRQKAFDVALNKNRSYSAEVLSQRIKFETLTVLARSAGALPGFASRNAVENLIEVIPSLVSHNDRKAVLLRLAREALSRVLQESVPVTERLVHPCRRHPSRKSLIRRFIDEVGALRATVRKATLQQMISEAHASAGTGADLRPHLQKLLHTTTVEINDRRLRREPQEA